MIIVYSRDGKHIEAPFKNVVVLSQSFALRKPHILVKGVEHKHCSYCGNWFPLEEFYKRALSWDGKAQHCKECAQFLVLLNKVGI